MLFVLASHPRLESGTYGLKKTRFPKYLYKSTTYTRKNRPFSKSCNIKFCCIMQQTGFLLHFHSSRIEKSSMAESVHFGWIDFVARHLHQSMQPKATDHAGVPARLSGQLDGRPTSPSAVPRADCSKRACADFAFDGRQQFGCHNEIGGRLNIAAQGLGRRSGVALLDGG